MDKGDCYQANFDEMFKNPDTYNSDEWRLVHAMREHFEGSEWWGGHCFLLNTEENLVFDFSNGAKMRNDGKELVVDADEIYKKWNICKDGNWGNYMKDYWIPTFEPKRHALNQSVDK